MDQKHGVLRTAVFRLNVMVPKGNEGDLPRSDANTTLACVLQNAKHGEISGLRVLTDPDHRAGELLRLRQDPTMGHPSLSDPSSKPETDSGDQVAGPRVPRFLK